MKKIIKYIFILVLGCLVFIACEDPYSTQTTKQPTAYKQLEPQDTTGFAAALKTGVSPLTIATNKLTSPLALLTCSSVLNRVDTATRAEYKIQFTNVTTFAKFITIPITFDGKAGSDVSVDCKQFNDSIKTYNKNAVQQTVYIRLLSYIVKGGLKSAYTSKTATLLVTPNNYAPKAVNDVANLNMNATTTISVLANDTDPEGDALSVTAVTAGQHGTATISADGKKVLYTPNAGYSGTDNFSYTINDGNGNTSTATVDLVKPLYPDNVYMIGKEFGDWNWSNSTVVEMTPINGNPGKFWAVRYFANPSDGFKWNTAKAWGGDFNSLGTDAGFTTSDGNAFVATAGFYIVVVDYTINKITIEPAQVYGMGDCFGGWNAGQYPFVADGNVMKLTATNAGELRIYANASSAGVGGDWWRMEFVILDGKIAYRGNGGDQTRATVAAGKTVSLNFNNNTGTIQ
jgi:starch-binding outer membrane protein SusE/F